MNTRNIFIVLLALIVLGVIAFVVLRMPGEDAVTEPLTFAECASRYPVMESSPRRCVTPSGIQFVEEVVVPAPIATTTEQSGSAGISNLISVDRPTRGQTVTSPLVVTGSARGTWYFEASFPIELRNASGQVIAQSHGEAQSDWMTEDFVPFRGTLTFPAQPAGSTGTLILRNDNPSGDPARDKSVSIPVRF